MSRQHKGARPGFVLEVDRSTPPTLFWHGEGFKLEKLPIGSRVIYAPEPHEALSDPRSAIRHALLNHSATRSHSHRCSSPACASRSRSTTSRCRCPRWSAPTSARW